jgi:hypothetical protein
LCELAEHGGDVARLLLASAVAADHASGAGRHGLVADRVLALVEAEQDTASPFYRVSPLILWVYGRTDEFERRREDLRRDAEPAYAEWLDRIGKEVDAFIVLED